MSPKNSCFSHQWNTLRMNKQPPIATVQYTEIMKSGLWNSLNFLKNHSGHITTRTHTHIAWSLPRERSHHLLWQSCTPGAYLILMNSRFPRNYLSLGLWENKHSGTGLIWLHCHCLDQRLQSRFHNTCLIALESLAVMPCVDQTRLKSFLQVLKLTPAGNNVSDAIAIVFDEKNSRHFGFHPEKCWAAAVPSKSKERGQCHTKARTYLITK